jgi:hypothetical protein
MTKTKKAVAKVASGGPKVDKQSPEAATAPKTKLGRLEALLRRPEGATIT